MKYNQQNLIRDFIRIGTNCILALINIERWYGGCGRSSYHDLGQVSSYWDSALRGELSDDKLREEIHKYSEYEKILKEYIDDRKPARTEYEQAIRGGMSEALSANNEKWIKEIEKIIKKSNHDINNTNCTRCALEKLVSQMKEGE